MGIWVRELRPVVRVLDLVVLASVVVDFVRTPAPKRLSIRRHVPARVGLSVEFPRELEVEAVAGDLELEIHEEASESFEVVARTVSRGAAPGSAPPRPDDPGGGPDRARLSRSGRASLVRVYRPRRRGSEELGALRVRVHGPWGLVARQARLPGRSRIAVEPALLGLRQTLRLAASERWRDLGVRRLRRRGGLTEFESLRDYVPGDDVRMLDWKAFARRGRPTVREMQEERGQELVFLVDAGRRMAATTGVGDEYAWSKLDHALDTALQIAAVALDRGDRVGICAFEARVRAYVPPARGGAQLARLRRAVFDLLPSELESDLEAASREVLVRHRRRATWIVLSDVADTLSLDVQRRALEVGARRNPVIFAALDDPALRSAADGRLDEPVAVRAAALAQLAERRAGLRELARSGTRVLDALPAEAAAPVLAAWLDARRSGR